MSLIGDAYLRQWLLKANEDIDTLNVLVSTNPEKHASAICFHAQQAVEKFLKAFLVHKNIDFPRTHDVDMLLSLCKPMNAVAFDIELKELTEFGVDVRYPDDFFHARSDPSHGVWRYCHASETHCGRVDRLIVIPT